MADQRDDEARLEAMWRAHHRAVLAYCRRRTSPDEAAEVAAEVFAVAWRRLEVVPGEPRAWLLGVARRALANHRRAESRRSRLLVRLRAESVDMAPAPNVPDRQLGEALARLTAREREALLLINWDGLSTAEAAVVCGCTQSALRVRLHRARRRLASSLEAATPGTTRPDHPPEEAADEPS